MIALSLLSPSTLNQTAMEKGFVHILDDLTLGTVLQELDTVLDFAEYLSWRESLVYAILNNKTDGDGAFCPILQAKRDKNPPSPQSCYLRSLTLVLDTSRIPCVAFAA